MIRWIGLAAILGLSGCTYYYYPAPGTASPYGSPSGTGLAGAGQPQANCREFTQKVIIGGKETEAVGQMCQQPDGTWRLM